MARSPAGWSLNYSLNRVLKSFDAAGRHVSPLRGELEDAARAVRDDWRGKIRSDGRASQTSYAEDVIYRVTEPRSGGYSVGVGWLNNRPASRSTSYPGTSWYVFQDSGFRHYRSGNFIEGIGAFLDARDDLRLRTERIADDARKKIARDLRGK